VDYGRVDPGPLSRWVNRTFTRENVLSGLRTLAWVAPLTVLIWVYAEREQEWREPNVTIPVAIKSADPGRSVKLLQRDSNVRAELIGPRAQVERVMHLVQPRDGEAAVQIEIDRNYLPGEIHRLSASQRLAESGIFKSHGVSVRDVSPAQLEIFVDEIVERDLDVKAPASVTNLATPPTFEPKTVRVRGPKRSLDNPAQGQLLATADLAGRPELRSPGVHELPAVAVSTNLDEPTVTITPATVKATLDVRQSDVRYTIPSVPIFYSAPHNLTNLQKYKLEYNPFITNVTVIGPPDKIELLRREEFPKKARFEVSDQDVGRPTREARLVFDLPDGVHLSKEDQARATVAFRITEVTSPE
jgi:hypothetical protein